MATTRRERHLARPVALFAALVIVAAACGDDDEADPPATASTDDAPADATADTGADADDTGGAPADGPGILVEPAGVTAFDDLLTVSPAGRLVYELGEALCVFETPGGTQEFCVAFGESDLGGAVAEDATWLADENRVAFTVGDDQVVVLDLDEQTLTVHGSSAGDAAGAAVTSPFVRGGELGFVRADEGGQLGLAGSDGEVLLSGWADDPEAPDDRPLVLTAGDRHYTYTAVGDPIALARLDDELALESADVIEVIGDIMLSVKRATGNEVAIVHSVTSDWSVLTWHLVTADGVTFMPFSGSDAAPAPAGSDAVGMFSPEPGSLLRWDSTVNTVIPIAEFDEPIDEVFWPTADTVFVRIGAQVHLVSV